MASNNEITNNSRSIQKHDEGKGKKIEEKKTVPIGQNLVDKVTSAVNQNGGNMEWAPDTSLPAANYERDRKFDRFVALKCAIITTLLKRVVARRQLLQTDHADPNTLDDVAKACQGVVSNTQLIKNEQLAWTDNMRSVVAEQKSISVAWKALLSPSFEGLQTCLFVDRNELDHLNKVIMHSVIVTDKFDKELDYVGREYWRKETTMRQLILHVSISIVGPMS
jgi:hypothetical protein